MNDLISRQAAKNKKVYSEERHEYVIPVAEIDWLPSAQPDQRWIPVSEKLPIPNQTCEDVFVYYLVQNEYGDMMVATFVQFPGGARVWRQMYQDGAIMEDIVAWMPLPECYKGES